jgi:L-alanine-DL-glutamate epimerase-like enolase superfamily enzyme
MSRRIRKRKTQDAAPQEARFKPKAGPGSVFVEEFVSAKTGGEKRLRNIGEHPLTLAHARGKISDEQFAAGEDVRRLYELRGASGRDSTAMNVGGGGSLSMPFTQMQVDAIRRLDHYRARLKQRDWIIVEKFCGEGWSMAEAIRAATACHPSGVLLRLQEALDELVAARREPRGRVN